jgi:hypothetical protein
MLIGYITVPLSLCRFFVYNKSYLRIVLLHTLIFVRYSLHVGYNQTNETGKKFKVQKEKFLEKKTVSISLMSHHHILRIVLSSFKYHELETSLKHLRVKE